MSVIFTDNGIKVVMADGAGARFVELAQDFAEEAANSAEILVSNDKFVQRTSPPNLTKWRRALARVRASTGRARILYVGDSTGRGFAAGTGSDGNENGILFSPPALLARAMNHIVPTSFDSVMGIGALFSSPVNINNNGAGTAGYADPRISRTTSDVSTYSGTGNPMLGGDMFWLRDSGTGSLRFQPSTSHNITEVFFFRQPSGGGFNVEVDGNLVYSGPDQNISTAGSDVLVRQVFSYPVSTDNVSIQRNGTGNDVVIMGVICYNANIPGVDIINGAWPGAKAQDWAQSYNAYTPIQGIRVLAPDLTIIDLGYNDRNANRTSSQYGGDLLAIIAAAQESGDVLVIKQAEDDGVAIANSSLTPSYRAAIDLLEAPTLDMLSRWEDFATSDALGYFFDGVHPTGLGNGDKAAALLPIMTFP